MSQPIRTSLATNIKSRSASTAKDARIVNGYVETIEDKKYVVKRPGLTSFTTNNTNGGAGIYNFNGTLKTFYNNTGVLGQTTGVPLTFDAGNSYTYPTAAWWICQGSNYNPNNGTFLLQQTNVLDGIFRVLTIDSYGNVTNSGTFSGFPGSLFSSLGSYYDSTNNQYYVVTYQVILILDGNTLAEKHRVSVANNITSFDVLSDKSLVYTRIGTTNAILGKVTPTGVNTEVTTGFDTGTFVVDQEVLYKPSTNTLLVIGNIATVCNIARYSTDLSLLSTTSLLADGVSSYSKYTVQNKCGILDKDETLFFYSSNQTVYKYNSTTLTKTASVAVPTAANAQGIKYDYVNNLVFIWYYSTNVYVNQIDVSSCTVISSWTQLMGTGTQPTVAITINYFPDTQLMMLSGFYIQVQLKVFRPYTLAASTSGPLFFSQTSQKPYLLFSNTTNTWVLNGATGVASTISNSKIAKLTLNSGGAGYTPGTGYSLTFTGGGGSGAAGTFDVNSSGTVTNVTLTNGGTGYTSAPTVSFPGTSSGVPALFAGLIYGSTLSVYEVYDGTMVTNPSSVIGQKVTGMGTVAGNEPIITSVISVGTPATQYHGWGGGVGNGGVTPTVYGLDRAIPTPAAFEVFNVGGCFVGSVTGNLLTVTSMLGTNPGFVFGTNNGAPCFSLFTASGGFIGTFASLGTGVGGVGTYYLQSAVATNVPAGTKMVCAASPASAMTTANQAGASCTAMLNAFPTTQLAVGSVYLDDITYVMDITGRIYNSGIEDPTTWGALDYITKTSEPDGGVAITKHMNWLVAFGKWSMEFFYNAGNSTGSPLNRNDTAKQEIGCANGWSVCSFMDTVVWIGQTREAGRGVYMLNGQVPQKISSEAIERFLNADTLTSVRAYPISLAGHYFYVLQLKSAGYTFVYDISEKMWYQWTSSDVNGNDVIFRGMFGASVNGVQYIQDESTGEVLSLSVSKYQDDSSTAGVVTTKVINHRIVTNLLDGGTNARKFFSSLEVIGDITTTTIQIRHSDDDYNTWSSYRTVDMSVNRPIIRQLGAARRRAYEFLHTDNTPLRIEGIELNIEGGTF